MTGEQVTFDPNETDPEKLAAMFAALEAQGYDGEEPTIAAPAPDAEPAPAAAPEAATPPPAAPPADAPAPPAPEAQPAAAEEEGDVATRDGKGRIPFEVLKATRERVSAAEREAADARKEAEDLKKQLEAAKTGNQGDKPGPAAPDQKAADDLTDEELAILQEDYPTVFKALMATRQNLTALSKVVDPLAKSVQDDQAERQRTVEEQVQDAIDATPKLAYIKAHDSDLYNQAVGFDKVLRQQPAWQGKSYADRFAQAIKLVEATSGEIKLPGAAATPAQAVPAAPAPAPQQLTAAQQKEQAKAVAAAAAAASKTAVPASLSEFPVGESATTDENQAAQNLTASQLESRLMKMSPTELDAYLAKNF